MKNKFKLLLAILLLANHLKAQVNPKANTWKTWFISSAKDFPLPAPDNQKKEIEEILFIQKNLRAADLEQITFWNAGSPSYRWQNWMAKLWQTDAQKKGMEAQMIMNVAIYDATLAAWDNKYIHSRRRPYLADKRIRAMAPKPESPAYPCEYSVAAGAAVTIISHYFPKMADSAIHMSKAVMATRIAAGMAFPSDTRAGFELGKRIAEIEIEKVKDYQNVNPWDGKLPKGEGLWNGQFAYGANSGKSKTVALDSASQFRPTPPPNYAKEMEELRNFKQTQRSMANALYYDNQANSNDILNAKMFEYNIHLNPPKAAQLYAINAIGMYDGFVACFEAKYAYWGIRPEQYDPSFVPLFKASPPFPGYPSGHAAVSSVAMELLTYFFPKDKAYFQKIANDIAESRFQGGIHFRTDNEVGLELGKKVAAKIIEKAEIKTP
jgi:hypothetical protein